MSTANDLFKGVKFLLTHNGWWKLLSLALALLIYFLIRSEISHVRTLTVPIEVDQEKGILDAPSGSVVESIEPPSIQVKVRGSYGEITQLAEKNIRCLIRPRQKHGDSVDTLTMKISNSNMKGLGNLRVVDIEPNRLEVKFDFPMSIELPVSPPALDGRARGRVELAYEKGTTPPNATINGSRRLLSKLDPTKDRIQPDPIQVEGRMQTFTHRVKLNAPGNIKNAKIEPSEMIVTVNIINEQTTLKLEHIPVTVLGATGVSTLWAPDPAIIDVELTGKSAILGAIRESDIMATANGNIPAMSGDAAQDVPVKILLRHDIEVDDVKSIPASIKLVAKQAPAKELKTTEESTNNNERTKE